MYRPLYMPTKVKEKLWYAFAHVPNNGEKHITIHQTSVGGTRPYKTYQSTINYKYIEHGWRFLQPHCAHASL